MSQAVDKSPPSERRNESSTLHALVQMARRLGIDAGYEELRRNYAVPDGEPETRMVVAIARDMGIEAKSIRIKFKDLTKLGKSLPAIIRVSGGGALILERAGVDPKAGPVAILSDPTTPGNSVTAVDESKLNSIWQGEVILVKRRVKPSEDQQEFGLGWLMRQVLREKRLFVDIGAAAIVSTVFALAPPFVFKIVIDRVIANHSLSTLKVVAGGLLLLILFEMVLTFLRRLLLEVAATRIDSRLNLYVMDKIFRLPMDYFERNPTGRITAKVSRIWQIRNFLVNQMFGTFFDSVPLLGLIPVLFILDYRLAFLVIAFGGIVFLIILAYIRPLGRKAAVVVRTDQRRSAHLVESIHGIRTIKALTLEGRRRREWDQRIAESMEAKFDAGKLANYPVTFALPFERLIYSGSFCVGAYLTLTSSNAIGAGTLGAFAMLAMRVGNPLIQIAKLQMEYSEIRGSINELATVLNAPSEDSREGTGMRMPIEGAISFRDVRFRYSNDAPYALDGVSFNVPKGMSLGVMGRSGSGKTTVTRLLQRLNSTYDGMIKIDGMDLREIELTHLRSNVGVVLQENFLFSGSIRENISIARPDASLSQIVRAAQMAGAEEFIERLPRGYDTHLQEGAANLSGGQRQRLAIARALLNDPPILLLDEATSALDAESEAIVNANLKRIAQGRTVVSISHRLSMLVDCDAIMVLERGKLYDMGTHDELLERCDIYKQLWYQQNRHVERASKSAPIAAIGQG